MGEGVVVTVVVVAVDVVDVVWRMDDELGEEMVVVGQQACITASAK